MRYLAIRRLNHTMYSEVTQAQRKIITLPHRCECAWADEAPANTTAMVITLMIGSFVAILNQTLMISALPTLMHEFDVPSSTVQWLTTGFMLTNGIMIPITAFLIETFTTRQLFLYAMGIFAE